MIFIVRNESKNEAMQQNLKYLPVSLIPSSYPIDVTAQFFLVTRLEISRNL